MTKKRAALYVRVSTDAQREEGYSIDAQKEMLEAYCKSKLISDYDFYVDGGFSGSSVDRPEIQRLIADVKKGDISSVVVYKLDRLSRSQKDTLYLIEDVFNPFGVGFVSLNENMDTSTPIGRAMVGIMSAFAQLERETIRERTRMGMRERVKEGFWPGGGKIPFGYDYDRERGILVPNSDADKVKQIYELYLSGCSFLKISRILDLPEHQAQQIMLRKTNIGKIVYNGAEYDGKHEAIIDDETYNRALELYKKRSRASLTTSHSLLAGLLICGICGCKMRYQKWGDRGYKIYCYSQDSSKRHVGGDLPCSNGKVWADEIEHIVIGDLFEIASKRVSDEGEIKEDNALTLLKSRKTSLEKRLKNLYLLYSDSEEASLLELIGDSRKEMVRIDEEIERIEECERNAVDSISAAAEIAGLGDAWRYMTHEERQAIIRRAIEKIVITHDRVEIFYSF
jgi:site-specific DNA recombinase